MRKIGYGLAALAVPMSLWATQSVRFTVDEVNARIAEILAPLNNNLTRLEFQFTELEVADSGVARLAANGTYRRTGSHNVLDLSLKDLQYGFTAGETPKVVVDARMELDLYTAFGRSSVNELAPAAGEMIKSFAEDFTRQYGAAASIDADIAKLDIDENGNVQRLEFYMNADMDFSQLPQDVRLESVYFQSIRFSAAVTPRDAEVKLEIGINPDYSGNVQSEQGLRRYLEDLLTGNQTVINQLYSMWSWIDSQVGHIVDTRHRQSRP